ncbi:uncharacterized protein LOC129243958 isoform X1 [Anastrepha obliqua]|uniref:uncharacterized protein LOC129243958 isoform X1 n=1 Tax=Anastrepha obliqua TaxID=95512 RepID=UPI00240A4304|nr:uncharacterized protein LOC129243958 isoform X1 [Anastrepha obliqua]XP_054737433.1 uncharacterized protein LOC129243958 isoform X1 [Anastrepha obliqua]XP_054737435.1 uncharacterized protein LOC129243958 isoform X1 [Anastrepha obliqua]XP_054737436.1 uncharacterized protein LOC129243958 isoform X1 [Anastrepha obliqua]XP_054737437.1 uncharacterized protein LOC129243958 isoform X1 [Anastrepha obliqua]XP_054737438.1 uncharacterized protein LOC129243958 isoform X1 [Anastrepha obliqua]XP_05473743
MEVENRPVEQPKCSGDAGMSNLSASSTGIPEIESVENSNKYQNSKSTNNKFELTAENAKKIQNNPATVSNANNTDKSGNTLDASLNPEVALSKVVNACATTETISENDKSSTSTNKLDGTQLSSTIKKALVDDNDGTTTIESNAENNSKDNNSSLPLDDSQDDDEDDESQKEVASTADDDIDNSLSPSTQSQTPPPKLQVTAKATNASVVAAMGVAASIVVADAGISAAIPDTILSPPKSETQTDDANTATSSSSPASDSQLSPMTASVSATALTPTKQPEASDIATTVDTGKLNIARSKSSKIATKRVASSKLPSDDGGSSVGGKRVVQPINVVANGTIPKSSGKPQMSAMNKKLKEKTTRAPRQRKQKSTVPIYESEISDNKTGIKLCIKKSDSSGNLAASTGALTPPVTGKSTSTPATINAPKQTRKRSRKSKSKAKVDSDESEFELTSVKRGKNRAGNSERQKKVSFTGIEEQGEKHRATIEQGDWGARIPPELLFKIFEILIDREGCLPTLCRLARVCTLWRNVSLTPSLWKSMDLSTWIKDKYRTELKLKWFVDNRCSECTELNVANWKMSDINCFLNKLAVGCPNLISITLSGWKGFTSGQLAYLTENMQKLQRLDLSSINVEMNASKSAVGPQSLCIALRTMNSRLTHLYLAHNRLAGIPQIVSTLATHCPNLVNLDLSNVNTQATSHGIFHIEKLQHGCPKLKVLRVTNSHITWSNATLQETMDSPGFPELEELSVAALTDECRVFGDDHLQRILKTSSKLKLLDVRGCARLTHESLIRLPAWDIKHLFLSFCSVTRDVGSGLELIASKWAHSLIELDLAWANVQQPLDNALRALAEKGSESPLAHLNLCGSSVSDEAVKEILANCAHMSSINLSSCRGLPRGVKRLMQGQQELQELREVLKVQMKVKLPAQIKLEQEEEERRQRAQQCGASADGDNGGGVGGEGDGGGGNI